MASPRRQIIWGPADLAADSSAAEYTVMECDRKVRVLRIAMTSKAAVTARNTNYNTWKFLSGSTTVGLLRNGPASDGVSFAKGVMAAVTLVSKNTTLANNAVLTLESTKSGTGLAVTGCTISVEFEDVD